MSQQAPRGPRDPRLRRAAAVGGIGLAALGAGVLARDTRRKATPEPRHGVAGNGMEYLVIGEGPKHLLFIQGGPGSEVTGFGPTMLTRHLAPYVAAGYTAWIVTRRRGMPPGYSLASMADDHAEFIREHLDGRADLVIGASAGGVILPYLAANHPSLVRHAVFCYSAATITQRGKEFDLRLARARAERRFGAAGAIMLESVLPSDSWAPVRRVLGLYVGRPLATSGVPAGDLLVEAEAVDAYDARDVMPRIQCPVLMLSGTTDLFFPPSIVDEAAALTPDCTVIRYPGGHSGSMNARIPPDVLAWVAEHDGSASHPATTPTT